MARIAGVDLPNNKRGEIGLTYIFGIGRSSAKKILDKCGIDYGVKCGDWNDEQIAAVTEYVVKDLNGFDEEVTAEDVAQLRPTTPPGVDPAL